MGRLGNSPSSRGYATPTYSTTQITARETFGGPAKAGLGRHIGMGEWTFGAIVNGSSGPLRSHCSTICWNEFS